MIAYMAVIFALSAQPYLRAPTAFGVYDKLHHVIIYFGLGLVTFRGAVLLPLAGRPGAHAQSLLIGVLYGASDEYHQKFVAGRTASGLDWLADVAGLVAALALICVVRKLRANGGR